MTLTKEQALDILESGKGGKVVSDTIVDHGRWAVGHRLIFQWYEDNKLYQTHYRQGATEMQDESPWEYEEKVDCHEVVAVAVSTIDYVPVTGG